MKLVDLSRAKKNVASVARYVYVRCDAYDNGGTNITAVFIRLRWWVQPMGMMHMYP